MVLASLNYVTALALTSEGIVRSSELRFQPRSEKTPKSVLLIAVALPRLFWLSIEIGWEGQVNNMKPRLCVGFPGDSEVKNLPAMQETQI